MNKIADLVWMVSVTGLGFAAYGWHAGVAIALVAHAGYIAGWQARGRSR